MDRIPPNLVYLTIYNPSLRSTHPPNVDDEDAEEQAHILFYTSKERAVSRDRMLRQIGLAKALVSFSEMFNAQNPVDTVHSQMRRMVMVSPEPNFWIHACIELAKVPRVVYEKGKGKGKEKKGKLKGKEREKDKDKDEPGYDCEDSSVHDGALKEDIMRGYERFKLIHGSFTSILSALGQEALEVQLERFWTPWAWSWSLEDNQDFSRRLGVAFHPYFKALIPALDGLQDELSQDELSQDEFTTLLLSSTSIIPSSNYLRNDYPISLPLYFASLIPLSHDSSQNDDDDGDGDGDDGVLAMASSQATIKGTLIKDQNAGMTSSFLNNMQAMDVRKWNWGGVLNFGRNSAKTSLRGVDVPDTVAGAGVASTAASSRRKNTNQQMIESSSEGDGTDEEDGRGSLDASGDKEGDWRSIVEGTVDLNALDDAISSQVSPAPSINDGAEEDEERTIRESEVMTPKTISVFLRKMVYLQDGDDPLSTSQKRVYFLLRGPWMLILIHNRAEAEESEVQRHLDHCSRKSERFFATIEEIIAQEQSRKAMNDSLPSATKILQPVDVHIGSTGKYTFGSENFHSKSGILHEARALQDRDPEILEVFSRGQNPQHWHMARRTRSVANTTGSEDGGSVGLGDPLDMYMKVFRKEASLSDVDNVMVGAVKTWKGVIER